MWNGSPDFLKPSQDRVICPANPRDVFVVQPNGAAQRPFQPQFPFLFEDGLQLEALWSAATLALFQIST